MYRQDLAIRLDTTPQCVGESDLVLLLCKRQRTDEGRMGGQGLGGQGPGAEKRFAFFLGMSFEP